MSYPVALVMAKMEIIDLEIQQLIHLVSLLGLMTSFDFVLLSSSQAPTSLRAS